MRVPSNATTPSTFVIAACLLSLAGVASAGDEALDTAGSSDSATASVSKPGLEIRLREATGLAPNTPVPRRLVPSRDLTDAETRHLTGRVPAPPPPPPGTPFRLPPGPKPPPRSGHEVLEPFPPPAGTDPDETHPTAPTPATAGPLEVIRHAPEGETPLVPRISLTFSQPMIALATAASEATAPIPVTIAPAIDGTWRWAGTRALVFEPTTALPMATEFTVTVDTSTRSAHGRSLVTPYRFTFSTPSPTTRRVRPLDEQSPPGVPLFIEFDQRIQPRAVLQSLTITGAERDWPLRLASADEVAASETVRELTKQAKEHCWLAFLPVAELPDDTEFELAVGPGAPSAEGPRRSTESERFSFRSVSALQFNKTSCGRPGNCRPGEPWFLEFNVALDPATVTEDAIEITPPLPNLRVATSRRGIYITGDSRGRTTYRIRLSGSIASQYGRTLGNDQEVTVRTGVPRPQLFCGRESDGFVVLEPTGPLRLPCYSINHRKLAVRLYSVDIDDWGAYAAFNAVRQRRRDPAGKLPPTFGSLVSESTIQVDDLNVLSEHGVDLTPALPDGRGHVLAWIESERGTEEHRSVAMWVQITDIALDAFVDSEEILVFASSLKDGRPLAGVRVSGHDSVGAGVTRGDGTLVLPLKDAQQSLASSLLRGRLEADESFLPESTRWWSRRQVSKWRRKEPWAAYRWYVVNDSGVYRPGETVKIKGWLRRMEMSKGGRLRSIGVRVKSVRYRLRGPQREEIVQGEAPISPLGGFDLSLDLPLDLDLGRAQMSFEVTAENGKGERFHHSFSVLHFRRPDFEVTVQANENIHLLGGEADVEVAASYYSGSHLGGADVKWSITAQPGTYAPPGHEGFTFGEWRPWWRSWSHDPEHNNEVTTRRLDGVTDVTGRHRIAIELVSIQPPAPLSVVAEASVAAPDNQTIAGRTTLLAHPSTYYVGLRTRRPFAEPGQPLKVEFIVTDIPGTLISERMVNLVVERLEWVRQSDGTWAQEASTVLRREATSTNAPVASSFTLTEGGSYRVTATLRDDEGRANQTRLAFWIAGGNSLRPDRLTDDEVSFVPEKEEYAPGETASVLIQAPFYPAEGILTVGRLGVIRYERFRLEGPTHTVTVPITDQHVPNVHLRVDLVGRRGTPENTDPKKGAPPKGAPAFASGQITLSVPPLARTLALQVTPRESELPPGAETMIDLEVRDAAGEAVDDAEVAVVVVDEAVLALLGHSLGDPLETFYPPLPAAVSQRRFRRHVLRLLAPGSDGTDGDDVRQVRNLRALGGGVMLESRSFDAQESVDDGGADSGPVSVRERFDARILFAPRVRTDANGRASVPVQLSDSVTRYRVMTVAAHGERSFGRGEAAITARLPVMVRATPPRFVHYGDRFELPVVVDNQRTEATEVDVLVRAHGARVQGKGRRISVAPKSQAALYFPIETDGTTDLRLQVAAVSASSSDAAEYEVPVWLPATAEATATYGTVAAKSALIHQPMTAPTDVIDGYGGLDITTSSTALHELTDAFLYLVDYPFECAEQIASRIIGVAALRDALDAFAAAGLPDAATLKSAMRRDLETLAKLQNPDGGFDFWQRSGESRPYLSVHVAHALAIAAAQEYDVPRNKLRRARHYLETIDARIPADYGSTARLSCQAYALRVLARLDHGDPDKAAALIRENDLSTLPVEAVGWLLAALRGSTEHAGSTRKLHALLSSSATESASTAQFTSRYDADTGAHLVLHSERRADAVVLDALLEGGTPRGLTELIPKLARGLLAQRRAGRWLNTQENAFVLLALGRYFEVYESETPSFTTRAWISDTFVGAREYEGRSADYRHVRIPTANLQSLATGDVVIQKTGVGRLYYRLGLRYAPREATLPALSRGMFVERAYEGVDDDGDVRRDDDGTWHIRSGARVRIRTNFIAPERRYHVALVDPLPAGLEPLQPEFRTTGRLPGDDGEGARPLWCYFVRWYEHENLRDRGAEVFASLVHPGIAEYSYFARATTPGHFVAPPTRVEEMYQPETFGRSASDHVIVESRP